MPVNANARAALGGAAHGRNGDKAGGLSDRNYSAKRDVMQARQYCGANGRVVAWLRGTTLVKHADASRHMLRVPPAWAFDDAILQAATKDGATDCEIVDRETGDVWRALLSDFRVHGFMVARGFGEQTGLALPFWRVQRAGAPVQLAFGFGPGA